MKHIERQTPASGNRLLREAVYDQLRADILGLDLPPGAEIREAELAARFELSKSPVRDALMRLEREGLVITSPRQGYRVAPIRLSDVQDMFHLRAVLERACVERIVQTGTDEQLQTLEAFRKFEPDAWNGSFIQYNHAFHKQLAELSGNQRLRDHLVDLIGQMERVTLMSVDRVRLGSGNTQPLADEHCRIIDALQARQSRLSERLAEQHISGAGKRVYEAISKSIVLS
jgi:DNA-binding GntR family transcriptional regulator